MWSLEAIIGQGGVLIAGITVVLWIWVRDDLPEIIRYLRLRKLIEKGKVEADRGGRPHIKGDCNHEQ